MTPITHRNREIERLERENKALREWIFDTMSTLVSTQNSELGDILTVLNMLSKSAAKVLNSTAHKQVSEHLERELAESREECRRLTERGSLIEWAIETASVWDVFLFNTDAKEPPSKALIITLNVLASKVSDYKHYAAALAPKAGGK